MPRKANGDLALDFIESLVRSDKDYHVVEVNEYFNSAGFEDCALTVAEEQALTANVPYKPLDIVKEFNVANSHNILKSDVVFGSGSTPYVTACEGNNSIVSHISYKDDAKEEVIAKAKELIADKLTGNIVKEIYVPGRIVNLVVK